MDGQLSIFDYLVANNEPPVLLNVGQDVFRVIKGEVIPLVVYDEPTWKCGENERGYRLQHKDGGTYDCTWNREIGTRVFKKYEDARRVADKYLASNEVLLKENIKPVKTEAYSYIYYDRKHINFYSILEDGTMYCDFFGVYRHISNDADSELEKWDREKAAKERDLGITELKDFVPEFINMYPVKDHGGWIYADVRFQDFAI